MTRTRRVFGRRTSEVSKKLWRFEMTDAGVTVRRRYGRQPKLLTFAEIVDVVTGPFQPRV